MTDVATKNARASDSASELPKPNLRDSRSGAQKDRDRILYCSAFRRLSGVTQVISPDGKYPTHNRLTHSLHVAQIAKAIVSRLLSAPGLDKDLVAKGGLIDIDAVEAAALAHDLGHPPFGHVAEKVLDRVVVEAGLKSGFEGNAQSFRILTKLAAKPSRQQVRGLDLTRGTLSAVSKYPWLRGQRIDKLDKWGAYETERKELDWSRNHLEKAYARPRHRNGRPAKHLKDLRTLEAQIMDFADDVAYAVGDIEDFYRLGIIPVDRLIKFPHELAEFVEDHCQKRSIADEPDRRREKDQFVNLFAATALSIPYNGSLASRSLLREFTSTMVENCISATWLGRDSDGLPLLEVAPMTEQTIHWFKDLIGFYVIHGRALASQRRGQATIIKTLFDNLCVVGATKPRKAAEGGDVPFSEKLEDSLHIMPRFFDDEIRNSGFNEFVIIRTAADVIAGLTEAQAIDLYRRMTGHSLGAALDPILA